MVTFYSYDFATHGEQKPIVALGDPLRKRRIFMRSTFANYSVNVFRFEGAKLNNNFFNIQEAQTSCYLHNL